MKKALKMNKKVLIIASISIVAVIGLGIGLGIGLSPKPYELTQIVNGVQTVIQVKNGTVLDIPPPTDGAPEGYEFDRWDGLPENGKMPKEPLTLTAVWKAKDYVLTIDGVAQTDKVTYGSPLSMLAALETKTGHTFVKWKDTNNVTVTGATTMPASDFSIVSEWTVNSYTLTINIDGTVTTRTLAYGAVIESLPIPSKANYTLAKWKGMPSDGKMPANNLTLTAEWRDVSYLAITSINNGTAYSITGSTAALPAVLEIPSNYMGLPVTMIGDSAFAYAANLTSVIIPDSVTSIEGYAFHYSSGLTSITIPDSVTGIGEYAFNGCTKLQSITIPASVTSIDSRAFTECSGLEQIQVELDNAVYKSQNNCLLTKDGKTLIYGCKNSVIPAGVTSIGNDAFYACSGLMSIEIPDSVTSIGDMVFAGCNGLTTITIPDSVTSIGVRAFSDCIGLANVYYEGADEAAWLTIAPNAGVDIANVRYYSATTKLGYWHYDTDGVTPVLWA